MFVSTLKRNNHLNASLKPQLSVNLIAKNVQTQTQTKSIHAMKNAQHANVLIQIKSLLHVQQTLLLYVENIAKINVKTIQLVKHVRIIIINSVNAHHLLQSLSVLMIQKRIRVKIMIGKSVSVMMLWVLVKRGVKVRLITHVSMDTTLMIADVEHYVKVKQSTTVNMATALTHVHACLLLWHLLQQ